MLQCNVNNWYIVTIQRLVAPPSLYPTANQVRALAPIVAHLDDSRIDMTTSSNESLVNKLGAKKGGGI